MPSRKESSQISKDATAAQPTKPTRVARIKKEQLEGNNANGNSRNGHKEYNGHQSSETILDNQELLRVLTEVKNGNFNVRMPINQLGLSGKICDTLNDIISLNEKMMQEFTRAGNTIGK